MRNSDCTRCPLHESAKTVCLWGQGPKVTEVMIVGEAPGAAEDIQGSPFVGESGRLLRNTLKEVGLTSYYITNSVKCRPPDNQTPTKKQVKACSSYLAQEISTQKPKFILVVGNTALSALLDLKGIKSVQGKPIEKDSIIYFPVYHPAYILRDQSVASLWKSTLQTFADMVGGKVRSIEEVNYRLVEEENFDEFLKALVGSVSVDIETTCLYPWAKEAEIHRIGFSTNKGCWILSPKTFESNLERIDDAIKDCNLIAHNGKFDLLWLRVHFGLEWALSDDTMLEHYLLDENSRHDLKTLASNYCNAPNYDVDLETKLGLGGQDKVDLYLANDVHYTKLLNQTFKPRLKRSEVDLVYKHLLMPAANAFIKIEANGVYVHKGRFDEAENHLLTRIDEATKALNKYGKGVNWGSTDQLAKVLFGELGLKPIDLTKGGKPSTSESVLKRLDHPIVTDLLKLREAKHQFNFFIKGWKPYLVGTRLHPSFKLHGTVTGRLSCENPNLQQVPRDPLIRSLIDAPPGWVLIEADLSQVELRLIAEVSGDPEMKKAFLTGQDIHWRTALHEIHSSGAFPDLVISTGSKLLNRKVSYLEAIEVMEKAGPDQTIKVEKAWKEIRKLAKAINFGFVYGMWHKKFGEYARDNYGVNVTEDEAKKSRSNFFQLYSYLEPWHQRQMRFARNHGYVRSMLGRKRRLPQAMSQFDSPERGMALRQSINSPIQSMASDWNLLSLLELMELWPWEVFRPFGTVHDSILVSVRKDLVEEVYASILRVMSKPKALKDAFGVELETPIEADASIGPWSQGVSLNEYLQSQSQ